MHYLLRYFEFEEYKYIHKGNEEGGDRGERVEELELEVGRGPDAKRCILHPVGGWRLRELLAGI